MPAYEYQALTVAGQKSKGIIEGDSPRQARQILKDKGLIPLKVAEIAGRARELDSSRGPGLFSRRGTRIKSADLALLTRQMATLVRSGMPLEASLATVAEQSERARVRQVVSAVRSRVLEGNSFADSLAEFPQIFNELYRATVAAGESSGKLEAVLEQLASYTENHQQLSQKLTAAMVYPAAVAIIAIIIVVGMMIKVVPTVVEVFKSSGQELPVLTQMMIAASNFIVNYGLLLLLVIIVAIVAFFWRMKDEGFHYKVDALLLKLPFIRHFIRGLNNERFTRTFSILVGSGVPALEGLTVSARVVVNRPMRRAVQDVAHKVREGSSIFQALYNSGYFPPMTVHLIASGEASGNLEQMLHQAAANQERELMNTISVLLALLEPLMILFMGGMILLIVLSIMLPIFNMSNIG